MKPIPQTALPTVLSVELQVFFIYKPDRKADKLFKIRRLQKRMALSPKSRLEKREPVQLSLLGRMSVQTSVSRAHTRQTVASKLRKTFPCSTSQIWRRQETRWRRSRIKRADDSKG